ncbi:MAG: hypothetical protein RXR31_08735 [Thermoproteota archaeon]
MLSIILYNLWIIARAGKINYREITAYIFRKTIEGLIKEKVAPRPPE